ncbi:hypothetical protein FRC00_012641, partial [Tulasnella sp. 408]
MKFLAIFIAILGFGPIMLEEALSAGRYGKTTTDPPPPELALTLRPTAPAPTPVSPTKTYDPSSVLNAGKELLQVPPTSGALLYHNNAENSAPAISISTVSQVTPAPIVASTGDSIINLGCHLLQYHWNNRYRLPQIDLGWVITLFQLLLPFLTVGAALVRERSSYRHSLQSEQAIIVSTPLDPNDALKCQVPRVRTTSPPPFPAREPSGTLRVPNATPASLEKAHSSPLSPVNVTGFTGLGDPNEDTTNQPVALKQLHRVIAWITTCSVEGYLNMGFCSSDSDCGNSVQWTITFHPRAHANTSITSNEDLLNILFRRISSYHPWAPQFVGVLEIPKEIVTELEEEDVTAIVPRIAPTLPQAVPNIEPEAAMALALVTDSGHACVTAKEESNTPATL